MPHFEMGIRGRTATCGILNESQNLKMQEGTTLIDNCLRKNDISGATWT